MRTGLDVIRRLCQARRLYPKLLHERLRDGEHWTDLFSLRRLKIGHHFSFWFQVENFILLLIWFDGSECHWFLFNSIAEDSSRLSSRLGWKSFQSFLPLGLLGLLFLDLFLRLNSINWSWWVDLVNWLVRLRRFKCVCHSSIIFDGISFRRPSLESQHRPRLATDLWLDLTQTDIFCQTLTDWLTD